MERTATGQWPFGTWLLAATIAPMMIGKPMMKRAYENLKRQLEK